MDKKVILTVGAPGSGKSTWALEQVEKSRKGNKTIVLNRDDMRAMLFGGKYKYSRENESLVTRSLLHTLRLAVNDEQTDRIIIADTNLNEATRKTIYDFLVKEQEHLGNNIIYEEMPFDVPWVELEKRNLTRGNKAVPKPVLRDMYLRMQKYLGKHRQYVPNPELPKAVIFDLDGTLANNDHRDAFAYWKLDKDTPVEFVVNILKMYKQNGYKILCVSGRNSGTKDDNLKYYNMTADWLSYNAIPWDNLYMRAHDDRRKDDITKEEIFWTHIADNYNVECAFDDRDRVIELWRRIGVNAAQVQFGEF
ncbi:polynucleotide 5'-kinase and 3'-phosphatase [Acinetobacter phage Stupor]|nr:polynucleotide 5'-kinase and 3'-phosphatase [Acinetobacter phage Stupor]WBF78772.1 polynucleotide 5'-kinase and 3'-phosphatase protein [Acinetobacter phage vB_AbaM_DLP2]